MARVRRSLAEDGDRYGPPSTRAVKLAEEDVLPRREIEPAFANRDRFARPDDTRLNA